MDADKDAKKGEFKDAVLIDVDAEMLKDYIWKGAKEKINQAFAAVPSISIVIPVRRLLEVLNACESGLVQIDFLPGFEKDTQEITHVVNGKVYQFSIIAQQCVDLLRVNEVTTTGILGDSAALMGCIRRTQTYVEDAAKKKEALDMKRKELLTKFTPKKKLGRPAKGPVVTTLLVTRKKKKVIRRRKKKL